MENSTALENYSQIQNVGTLFSGLHEQVVLFVPAFYVSFFTPVSNYESYKPELQARDFN